MNKEDRKPEFPKLPEGYFWRIEDGAVGNSTKLSIYRDLGNGQARLVDYTDSVPDASITIQVLEYMADTLYTEFTNTQTAKRLRGDYRP